jgi:nucleoside-diphosphate-sugar epimerase
MSRQGVDWPGAVERERVCPLLLPRSEPTTAKFMQKKAWTENDRVRKQGSATIIDAAIAAGVERVVQESVSMMYPDRGDAWIDEECPPDNFPMAQANLAAEANANRFSTAGGTGVVLRFGWFYGPGATHSEEFFALQRRAQRLS